MPNHPCRQQIRKCVSDLSLKAPFDRIVDVRDIAIHTPTLLVDVRVLDIATPQEGDTLTIGTLLYAVQGEPVRDAENLVWTLDCYRQ